MISGFVFILFRGEWPWDGRSQLADSALYLLTRSGLRSCSARSQHVADPTRARQTATRRLGGYSVKMSRQRGTCGSGTSAPSLAGQVSLPPRVEHQQGPEDLLMVPRARDMLSDEPGCRTRIEESDASDLLRIQACLEHAAQRAAHP